MPLEMHKTYITRDQTANVSNLTNLNMPFALFVNKLCYMICTYDTSRGVSGDRAGGVFFPDPASHLTKEKTTSIKQLLTPAPYTTYASGCSMLSNPERKSRYIDFKVMPEVWRVCKVEAWSGHNSKIYNFNAWNIRDWHTLSRS